MSDSQSILNSFILLWAVIDPIGTMPVFVAATRNHTQAERQHIALRAALVAAGILLFFILIGESLLNAMRMKKSKMPAATRAARKAMCCRSA